MLMIIANFIFAHLASFMKYRQDVCGITEPLEWQAGVSNADIIALYGDLDKLEIFPGGLLEKIPPGQLVGPTFACLLRRQFQSLKDGDRFFFSHQTSHCRGFSSAQQGHIMTRTLRDIIWDNTPTSQINQMQPHVNKYSNNNLFSKFWFISRS